MRIRHGSWQFFVAHVITGDADPSVGEVPSAPSPLFPELRFQFGQNTALLTTALRHLTPNTGWYPEDPLTGFLYPNNTNHVGEGSISYLVRPKSGLASGATITNRANIVFDYSDPILLTSHLDSLHFC